MNDYQAAVARCIDAVLREGRWRAADLNRLTIRDLPAGPDKSELMHSRFTLGLSTCPNSRVLLDTLKGH